MLNEIKIAEELAKRKEMLNEKYFANKIFEGQKFNL